jgi:hypothetical protein
MGSDLFLDFNFEYFNDSYFYLLGENYYIYPYISNLSLGDVVSNSNQIDLGYEFN